MKINNNSYVTRDVAELLQKLDYKCENEFSKKGYYLDSNILSDEDSNSLYYDTFIIAPLLFEVEKWLREKHDIHIEIVYTYLKTDRSHINEYWGILRKINQKSEPEYTDEEFSSYEEALNESIKQALKNI